MLSVRQALAPHDTPTAELDGQHWLFGLMQMSPHLSRAAVKGRGKTDVGCSPCQQRQFHAVQHSELLTDAANCPADTGVCSACGGGAGLAEGASLADGAIAAAALLSRVDAAAPASRCACMGKRGWVSSVYIRKAQAPLGVPSANIVRLRLWQLPPCPCSSCHAPVGQMHLAGEADLSHTMPVGQAASEEQDAGPHTLFLQFGHGRTSFA